MKTKLFWGLALAISIISCADEDLVSLVKISDAVGSISLNTSVKEAINVSTSGKANTLDGVLDNLSLEIFDDSGATVIEDQYRNLAEFIELPVGSYTVVFYTLQNSNVRFDIGSYGSEPKISFNVERDANTIVPVTLRLFDVATTIDFSDELLDVFPDINAKVHITPENNQNALEWFSADDSRVGYFTMIDYVGGNGGSYTILNGDLAVEISALNTSGEEILVTKTYPSAMANQHYKLLISYDENATVDFDITLGGEDLIEDEITFPHGDENGENSEEEEESSETTDSLVAGDLIVTEIMNNPAAVSDANGEWFELFNTTGAKEISLNGLRVVGASSEFTLDTEITVAPGDYVVLGKNGDVSTNGGVAIDYVYTGFTLTNSTGSISIVSEAIELDQVIFDDFDKEAGKAMQLSANTLNHLDNDAAVNWCLASATLDSGDAGSPATANDSCN